MGNITKNLLYARHHARCFLYITHIISHLEEVTLSAFCRRGKLEDEGLSKLLVR